MLTDQAPAHELGILYPDVEAVRPGRPTGRNLREIPLAAPAATIPPAPLSIPLTVPVQGRIVSVEIRDAANNKLVTSIEILSPANKREPGLSHYQAKRDKLRVSDVHVLEIDLLRRGTRPWPVESLPPSPYLAALMRVGHLHAEVWPMGLRERLPILPVPLRPPDPDVPLDVQAALDTVYDEARYALDHQLRPSATRAACVKRRCRLDSRTSTGLGQRRIKTSRRLPYRCGTFASTNRVKQETHLHAAATRSLARWAFKARRRCTTTQCSRGQA